MGSDTASFLTLERWDRLQLEFIRLYRGMPASWSGSFSSTYIVIWRINRGGAAGHIEQKPFHASPGHWLFHLPRRRFQSFQPGTEIDSVQMRISWPSGASVLKGPSPLLLHDRQLKGLRDSFEHLLAFGREEPNRRLLMQPHTFPLQKALQIRAALTRWSGIMLETALRHGWQLTLEQDMDSRVRKLTDCLQCQPLDQPLEKRVWAGIAAVGPARLTRLFHAHYGMTPRRYFEERRADYARAALEAEDRTVKEVASELGFTSLQRFSAWFKSLEGVAPRTFQGTTPVSQRAGRGG